MGKKCPKCGKYCGEPVKKEDKDKEKAQKPSSTCELKCTTCRHIWFG